MDGEQRARSEKGTSLPSSTALWKLQWPLSNKLNMILGNIMRLNLLSLLPGIRMAVPLSILKISCIVLLCKGPWNKLWHPRELFFYFISAFEGGCWERKFSWGLDIAVSGNLWKRKLPVMGLWLPPLPGCSEQVKLNCKYSSRSLPLIFTPEKTQSATFKNWIFTWQKHGTGGTVPELGQSFLP